MPTGPELVALQQIVSGRYSIERELGRGGMGIVFLARDVALERPVAIKLLPPQLAGDAAMRERFVREARTAARLSHPNIVPIHSVEEHGTMVFFVMGYIDGDTLTARVHRDGPMSPRDGSKLVQELAWALAYAHSAGIIHRDVKPDNVLIDRASGRAMLTDFGIARVTDAASFTGIGEVVGTAQYVSPEQASGSAVDARSDLYSLGVTAFYALTARLPFESSTLMGLLTMHVTQPAPPVATVREGLPPKLAAAVDRCLAKDPANRFASGEQLADAIAMARDATIEVAPPIRGFLRARARMLSELLAYYLAGLYVAVFAQLPGSKLVLPLGALGVASVVRLIIHARGLLRSGFRFADVRAALLGEFAERTEELGLANASPADVMRVRKAHRLRAGGFAAIGFGLAVGEVGLHRRTGTEAIVTFIAGAIGVVAGVMMVRRSYSGGKAPRMQSIAGRWIDRLWSGRFGSWFFALAGLGLKRDATRASATTDASAPTEVLLARAAEDLIASLPPGAKALLGPGRDVVERLQAQITKLRAREEQYASVLAEAGDRRTGAGGVPGGIAEQALVARRTALTDELERARRDAAERRAAAVAALENIRLQLLRVRSGLGVPSDLTADLDAAAATTSSARSAPAAWPPCTSRATSSTTARSRSRCSSPELGAVLGVERFLAEIEVTANLQHPNLLPLFDSGEADGLLFYVMPFVEGESLRAGSTARSSCRSTKRSHRDGDRERARLRAPARRDPPRPQAREHPAARRAAGRRGLRHRARGEQRRRRAHHADRDSRSARRST